jgi:hypothetical protein
MLRKGTDPGLRRWRAVALLVIGAIIGIIMVATPAGAHITTWTHLRDGHIKPWADKRYVRATGTLSIPGVAFVSSRDSAATFAACIPETIHSPSGGSFYAPVNLPHGAKVTRLTYHWWDAVAGDATVTLVRLNTPTTGSSIAMAAVSSSGADAIHTSSTTATISNGTIDNANAQYFVRAALPAGGDVCVDGVEINYRRP